MKTDKINCLSVILHFQQIINNFLKYYYRNSMYEN